MEGVVMVVKLVDLLVLALAVYLCELAALRREVRKGRKP